jgi:hypothetical protein
MISLLELNLYSGIIRVIPPLPHFIFALNFPGYKTGNVSTIKILLQNKMAKRFHVPDDTEIEENFNLLHYIE